MIIRTEHIVKPEDRLVICVLTADFFYADEYQVFKGFAQCHNNDVFSETLGKRIAEDRAHILYHQYLKNTHKERALAWSKLAQENMDIANKHSETIQRLKQKIKEV